MCTQSILNRLRKRNGITWFQPDVVVGIGFWGHVPHLVLHPQQFGMRFVPWLLADGYVAAHRELLNALPLILVTSNWVKEVYIRDGSLCVSAPVRSRLPTLLRGASGSKQ